MNRQISERRFEDAIECALLAGGLRKNTESP